MNSNQPFDVHGAPVGHVSRPDVRYGDTVTQVDPLGNPIPAQYQQPVPAQQYSPGQNFSLPPGTAQQAAQRPEPQPTIIDAIASDAEPAKVDPPEGAPSLRPIHRLPFRQRATAIRLFSELQKIQGPAEGEAPSFEHAADMYEGLARIDDFLATVADDADAYRAWVAGPGADETKFAQLWNHYSSQAQPGEASSSSS